MTTPTDASPRAPGRDHAFHQLRVREVVRETPDASSFVLDVDADLAPTYEYRGGQFLTFRFRIDGAEHLRCYSMSSAPATDDALKVTVKRVPGGVVSNWMNDHLAPGSAVEASPPAGVFCLTAGDGDIVAHSGGSGITPVMSIVKTALATTSRRVFLLYANRDLPSVIFDAELAELAGHHPDRLSVVHHLDVEDGFVDSADVSELVGRAGPDADHFVCGPAPFMDVVERTLLGLGVEHDRIHIERFTPEDPAVSAPFASADSTITIELGGRSETVEHHPGTTLLQMARQVGLSPPFSCESGSCASCMARLVEGTVSMRANHALTPDEVDDGWILTCQSEPTAPTVHVVYE